MNSILTRRHYPHDVFSHLLVVYISDMYLMICDDRYAIECCGSAVEFEFFAQIAGTLNMMIWRPAAGSTYELIGSVPFDVADPGNKGGNLMIYLRHFDRENKFK